MSALPLSAEAAAPPPNIIFVLADDLGWTDVSCHALQKDTSGEYLLDRHNNPKYKNLTYTNNQPVYSDGSYENKESVRGGEFDTRYYHTPNIARLREQSMRFIQAYAACPFCSPTRACLLTGKSPARLAWTGFANWSVQENKSTLQPGLCGAFSRTYLPPEETTIAEALEEYNSCFIGKWHLTDCMWNTVRDGRNTYPSIEAHYPQANGFDYQLGVLDNVHRTPNRWWESYDYDYRNRNGIATVGYWHPAYIAGMAGFHDPISLWGDPNPYSINDCFPGTFGGDAYDPKDSYKDYNRNEYLTDSHTQKALEFIDSAARQKKPFLLYLSHVAVHVGIDGKNEYRGPADAFYNKEYAAMIQSLDDCIGAIWKKLGPVKEGGLGIRDNTVIILTSDNGGFENNPAEGNTAENAPLRSDKNAPYEGGVRVPMLVFWPGKTDQQPNHPMVCHEPVTSADVFPTLVEMAGQNPALHETIEGVSLAPLLDPQRNGTFHRPESALFWHVPHWIRDFDREHTTPLSRPAFSSVIKKSEVDGQWYKLIKFYDREYQWNGPGHFQQDRYQLAYTCPGSYELYKLDLIEEFASVLKLDGQQDYIEIPGYMGIEGGQERTVSAWIKTTSASGGILSWGDSNAGSVRKTGWNLALYNGKLRLMAWGGNAVGKTDLNDNKWHHIAVTLQDRDSNGTHIEDIRLFVDGGDDTGLITNPNERIQTASLHPILVGARYLNAPDAPSNIGDYFNGYIAHVKIYGDSLPMQQIQRSALGENVSENLECYIKFNEGNGTIFHDASGNQRPGHWKSNHGPDWRIHEHNGEEINLFDATGSRWTLLQNNTNGVFVALKSALETWLHKVDAQMPRYCAIRFSSENLFLSQHETIQKAIDKAKPGDIIKICPGVHEETLSIGKKVTLQSIDPENQDIVESTVLMAQYRESTRTLKSLINLRGNSNGVLIHGITLAGGNATRQDANCRGIYVSSFTSTSSSMIRNCIIRNFRATQSGAGISNFDGHIVHCVIKENRTAKNGGAIYNCDGQFLHCIIVQNEAANGAGIYIHNGNPNIGNCTIANNRSYRTGGGLFCNAGTPVVSNCILWGNIDDDQGTDIEKEQIYNITSNITNSVIQGWDRLKIAEEYNLGGNFDHNPEFINAPRAMDITKADANPGSTPSSIDFLFDDLWVQDAGEKSEYRVGNYIEYDNDGVLRRITKITDNPAGYDKVEFHPPISPETQAGKTVFLWPADAVSGIENYHCKPNSSRGDSGNYGRLEKVGAD
ncbi:MAG: sulfatase-like hydrolase/transferase [Sedimentisphaerales bacterium]|nr:sulfatase-like hydrolase/transferase [Sedimentisphaerales bacterium]